MLHSLAATEMRLLHVASSYPLYPGDGTAPFMEEMVGALAGNGHEVTIIVPRVQGLEEGPRSGVRVTGAPYAPRRLQVWGHGRSLDARNRLRFSAAALTPLALGSMALALRSEIRRQTPDVVHLHWVLPQGVIALALPGHIPIVISAHGADARFARGRLAPVTRRILERADALVAASSGILDFLAAIHPEARIKSRVIPHGANDELIAGRLKTQARQQLGIDPSTRVLLGIGRLVPEKGFHHLIRSLEHVAQPNVHLFIVGDGPLRRHLEEEISSIGNSRVHLVGRKGREDVASWLAAADVVAVPSVNEGGGLDTGPLVLMEALAAGRPIVATPIGMAPEVLNDGVNGYLVESTQPASLGSALSRALQECERLGEGARRTFEQIGGWSRVAADLEDVYTSVMRPAGGS